MATKIFSIALFSIMALFTAWKLNLHLLIPKIEFEIPDKKPERKTIKIPLNKTTTKEKKAKDILTNEIKNQDNLDKANPNENIIKNILKDKIKKKVSEQQKQTEQGTSKINYPKDKPTFSIENLEK